MGACKSVDAFVTITNATQVALANNNTSQQFNCKWKNNKIRFKAQSTDANIFVWKSMLKVCDCICAKVCEWKRKKKKWNEIHKSIIFVNLDCLVRNFTKHRRNAQELLRNRDIFVRVKFVWYLEKVDFPNLIHTTCFLVHSNAWNQTHVAPINSLFGFICVSSRYKACVFILLPSLFSTVVSFTRPLYSPWGFSTQFSHDSSRWASFHLPRICDLRHFRCVCEMRRVLVLVPMPCECACYITPNNENRSQAFCIEARKRNIESTGIYTHKYSFRQENTQQEYKKGSFAWKHTAFTARAYEMIASHAVLLSFGKDIENGNGSYENFYLIRMMLIYLYCVLPLIRMVWPFADCYVVIFIAAAAAAPLIIWNAIFSRWKKVFHLFWFFNSFAFGKEEINFTLVLRLLLLFVLFFPHLVMNVRWIAQER